MNRNCLNLQTSNKEEENIVHQENVDETKTQSVQSDDSNSCFICKKTFLKKSALTVHIETVHDGKKPFKCSLCVSEFSQKGNLKLHIETVHEKKKPFTCSQCDASFGRKDTLKDHIKTVHDKIKPFVCSICNHSFPRRYKLKSHLVSIHKIEDNETRFINEEKEDLILSDKDEETDFNASNLENIQNIQPDYQEERLYVSAVQDKMKLVNCPYCSKTFSKNSNLKSHLKSHTISNTIGEKTGSLTCDNTECKRVFKTENGLVNHTCEYACMFCESRFKRKQQWINHVSSVHERKKPFNCKKCDFETALKANLNRHMESIHNKSMNKIFECKNCDKKFTSKRGLTGHVESVHEGKKPYGCDICTSSFSQRAGLKIHYSAVHEGKRPFKCDICDYASAQKIRLKTHKLTVHLKKPLDSSDLNGHSKGQIISEYFFTNEKI